jgi:hypothetical protein
MIFNAPAVHSDRCLTPGVYGTPPQPCGPRPRTPGYRPSTRDRSRQNRAERPTGPLGSKPGTGITEEHLKQQAASRRRSALLISPERLAAMHAPMLVHDEEIAPLKNE